jgi:hypothetical protein
MPMLRQKLTHTFCMEVIMDTPDGEAILDTLDYHMVLTDMLDPYMDQPMEPLDLPQL